MPVYQYLNIYFEHRISRLLVDYNDARKLMLAYDASNSRSYNHNIYTISTWLHGSRTNTRIDLSRVIMIMLDPLTYVLNSDNDPILREDN